MSTTHEIADATGADPKPIGRDDVMRALLDATTELIVEKGLSMSVREIAARAGVNHGLVHTYFGSKEALVSAAFADIHRRAVDARDEHGFPAPDIAGRRGGELAKALARAMLEPGVDDPFPEHGVTSAWRIALAEREPRLSADEVDVRVIAASSLALGYALFADHFARSVDPAVGMDQVGERIGRMVADIGGIPTPEGDGEACPVCG